MTRQATPFLVSDLKALIKAHGATQSVRKLETFALSGQVLKHCCAQQNFGAFGCRTLLNEQTGSFTLTVYRTKSTVSTLLTYHLTLISLPPNQADGYGQRDQQSHPKDYLFRS